MFKGELGGALHVPPVGARVLQIGPKKWDFWSNIGLGVGPGSWRVWMARALSPRPSSSTEWLIARESAPLFRRLLLLGRSSLTAAVLARVLAQSASWALSALARFAGFPFGYA